jgi:hypothetical protein
MNRIAAGLVTMGLVAVCLDSVSALAAANKTDPRFVWPKNSQFTCRGVLAHEQGTYRLTPDQGMLAWCDADIDDKDKDRVLDTCKLGDRCEMKGIIRGHGAFGWVEVTSIMAITHAAQLPEAYLGDWSSDDMGDIEITGIAITQRTYHEPGYNCDIRSVQPKSEATPGRPVYLVEMRCSGERPERAQLVREVWALRKVNNNDILAIAGVSGATFPSIHLLRRSRP